MVHEPQNTLSAFLLVSVCLFGCFGNVCIVVALVSCVSHLLQFGGLLFAIYVDKYLATAEPLFASVYVVFGKGDEAMIRYAPVCNRCFAT
jgi:hypothetical protein